MSPYCSSEKKLLKPLQIALICPIWAKTSSEEAMPKFKFNYFLEITKGDHKL